MELTLSPNFEREAIREIKARHSAESARPLLVNLVRVAAGWTVGGALRWAAKRLEAAGVSWIEKRNDAIAGHIRWFRSATPELAARVAKTQTPAGVSLGDALDGLIAHVDEGVASLLSLIELLDVNSPFGQAVDRSIHLLLEVKSQAIGMKRAGLLAASPNETTARIEAANERLLGFRQRLASGQVERDPVLLSMARDAIQPARGRESGRSTV